MPSLVPALHENGVRTILDFCEYSVVAVRGMFALNLITALIDNSLVLTCTNFVVNRFYINKIEVN